MIIDIEFVTTCYQCTVETLLEVISSSNFEKKIELYDKRFDMDFYNRTYAYQYTDYFEAYEDWMKKRQMGLKGYPKIVNGVEYFSQINQDYIVIHDVFKDMKNGTFVEFGACDGVFLSNTITLEKYFGWNGILIEPIESYFLALQKNRSSCCVQEVIYSENDKQIEFGECEMRELSGIVETTDASFTKKQIFKTKTLEKILDENHINHEIHFMSVDVEGAEYDILKVFPFNTKYKVFCLTIEHGYHQANRNKIRNLMTDHGYQLYKELLWDDMYVLPELL